MKEIPMLFSTAMVQAILQGKKTMTRRELKPGRGMQSKWLDSELINKSPHGEMINGGWQLHHPQAGQVIHGVANDYGSPLTYIACPYGQGGDMIWVKETFYAYGHWTSIADTEAGKIEWSFKDLTTDNNLQYLYQDNPPEKIYKRAQKKLGWHKRPSLFMPKAACRIWLEVTGIKVERLHDISEEDAMAEGVSKDCPIGSIPAYQSSPYAYCFAQLWERINGPESWKANPWVWVIGFKVGSINKN